MEQSIMKKNLQSLIITFLLVFAFSTPAAASGYYIGIQGGVGFLADVEGRDSEGKANFSYDGGFDGSVTVGYDLGEQYPKIGKGRIELEFNTASNDIDEAEFVEGKVRVNGSADRTSIMLNTIGEYTTSSGFIIYALLGLGWAEISLDNVSIMGESYVDDSSNELAYQAGVGVAWKFSEHFVFDVGYRYYGTTDPDFNTHDGSNLDYEYASHRLLAGLRLHF
jgi:opacity protein-like surface antigen